MDLLTKTYDLADYAKTNVTDFFEGEHTTSRKKIITIGTICFLTGVVLGFLFSPIKKGFYFNVSNNGNYEPGKSNPTNDWDNFEDFDITDKKRKSKKSKKGRKQK